MEIPNSNTLWFKICRKKSQITYHEKLTSYFVSNFEINAMLIYHLAVNGFRCPMILWSNLLKCSVHPKFCSEETSFCNLNVHSVLCKTSFYIKIQHVIFIYTCYCVGGKNLPYARMYQCVPENKSFSVQLLKIRQSNYFVLQP